jgi:hypothetical protein
MELQITWGRTLRVWWALLWRNLIATVLAMVIGMLVGFVVGFVGTLIGIPFLLIVCVAYPVSFLIGLSISIIPLWLILGRDFGEFRLVLLANPGTWAEQESQQATSPYAPQ